MWSTHEFTDQQGKEIRRETALVRRAKQLIFTASMMDI